jgi:hypothetical protein
VPLLFEWINRRQTKHHFFLAPGVGKNKTSNRSVAVRKVVSTLIFDVFQSVLKENATVLTENATVLTENATLRLEIAEARRALEEMRAETLRPTKLFGEEENLPSPTNLVPPTPSTKSTKKTKQQHGLGAPKTPKPKSMTADDLAKILGSLQVAEKVQTQNNYFQIGGAAAPQPPADESSSEGSSSSSLSSQESGGSS